MKLKTAIKTLELHNRWRRGDEKIKMIDPKKIGEAIDLVLDEVKKIHNTPTSQP